MKTFSLPNLRAKPQVFCSYIFNQKSYNFGFSWCKEFCLLDIFLETDIGNKYILKGFPIVCNINLLERVKVPELITGKLYIRNKYGKDIEPYIHNFHTDYEIVYYDLNESED